MSFSGNFDGYDSGSDTVQLNDQNAVLIQKNHELMEKIISMQKQLNESLEFVDKNEQLQRENADLQKQNRKLISEKNEVEKRFNILLKSQEESKQKTQYQLNNSPKITELMQENKFLKQENNSLEIKFENLQKQLEQKVNVYEQERTIYDKNISNLLQTAKSKFRQEFGNLFDFTQFLALLDTSRINKNIIDSSSGTPSPQKYSKIGNSNNYDAEFENQVFQQQKLITKIQKLQRKNKQLQAGLYEQEKDVEGYEKEIENLRKEIQQNKFDFEQRLKDEIHKQNLNLIQEEQENKRLQTEIQTNKITIQNLKEQIEKLKNSILHNQSTSESEIDPEIEQQQRDLFNKEELEEKLCNANTLIAKMKQNIINLTQEIQQKQNVVESLEQKIDKINKEKQKLITDLSEQKQLNALLQSEINTSEEKMKACLAEVKCAKLSFTQSKNVIDETEQYQQRMENALSRLNTNQENQQQEIARLYDERDKVLKLFQKQNLALTNCTNLLEKTMIENKKLKQELKQLRNTQNPPTYLVQEKIPPTSWFNTEFPRDLITKISDYANNESLSTPCKLRNVLQVISSYYGQTTSDLNKIIQALQKYYVSNEDLFDHFVTKFTTAYKTHIANESGQQNSQAFLTYQQNLQILQCYSSPETENADHTKEIINNADIQKAIGNINQRKDKLELICSIFDKLFAEKNDLNLANIDLQQQNAGLLNKLQAYSIDDGVAELDNLYDIIEKQKIALSNNKQENKKNRKIQRLLLKENKELQEKLDAKANENEQQENLYKDKIQKLTERNHKNEQEIVTLKGDIDLLRAQNTKNLEQKNQEIDEILKRNQFQDSENRGKQKEQEKTLQNALLEKDTQIKSLKQEIEQWKNTVDLLHKDIDIKTTEIQSLQNEIDELQEQSRKIQQQNKDNQLLQFSNIEKQLKNKNSELTTLNDKLVKSLEQTEQRLKELTAEKANLEHFLYDKQNKLKMLEESQERAKKLQESKTKAKMFEQQITFQCKLEEEKDAYRTRLQSIFAFVMGLFKEYFDFNNPINENNFTNLCRIVRSELDKLKASDGKIRSLLGISENEQTEDALSKLLLSLYTK